MPVIVSVPQDPTDLVLQGEEMRLAAISGGLHAGSAPIMASVQLVSVGPYALTKWPLAEGLQDYPPMHPDYTPYNARQRNPFAGTMIANNACISTPTGAVIPMDIGNRMMNATFEGADVRWQIVGVTRDSAGTALGTCRVVVMEAGRIAVTGSPVVAETISDGSGNYTVEVSLNTAHQVISYKAGSPDVAGITLNTLTPAAA